jgi:hypothetical protein
MEFCGEFARTGIKKATLPYKDSRRWLRYAAKACGRWIHARTIGDQSKSTNLHSSRHDGQGQHL